MINKKRLIGLIMVIISVFILAIMLYPLWWLYTSPFKGPTEISQMPPTFISLKPTLMNIKIVFENIKILFGMFLNSLYLSITIPLLQTIVCLLAAYAFAKLRFPGSNVIFVLFMASLMIPPQLTMITNFITISKWKLLNTHLSLQLLGIFSAFAIFLFRQFFMTIPRELEDAAKIDGCGTFSNFFRIALPLSTPIITINFILCFNAVWGDFFSPMLFLRKMDKMTIPIGLTVIQGTYNTQSPGVMITTLALSTLPVLIMYFIFRKKLIEGISTTGIKM